MRERHEETQHPLDCKECQRLTRGYEKKTGKNLNGHVWPKASSEHANMYGLFDGKEDKWQTSHSRRDA